jgi:hypothetical protein
LNKRILITCLLLIFCVSSLWTLGILGQVGDAIEYTARGLIKLGKIANDAASAYYNISAVVSDLQESFAELKADWETTENRFTGHWNAFLTAKARYEAEQAEFLSANADYQAADRQENLADIKIAHAEVRIAHCRVMLDATRNSQSAAYWTEQLSQA